MKKIIKNLTSIDGIKENFSFKVIIHLVTYHKNLKNKYIRNIKQERKLINEIVRFPEFLEKWNKLNDSPYKPIEISTILNFEYTEFKIFLRDLHTKNYFISLCIVPKDKIHKHFSLNFQKDVKRCYNTDKQN